ncbi:hypothetical protein MCEMSEM23_00437 [Rhabdaerophilaceae bacterium]
MIENCNNHHSILPRICSLPSDPSHRAIASGLCCEPSPFWAWLSSKADYNGAHFLPFFFHKRDDGRDNSVLAADEAVIGLAAAGISSARAAVDPDKAGAA